MKNLIVLLFVAGFAALGIYSCQKDNAEAAQSVTPNTTATVRADYADCDECGENCYDCCLKLQCTTAPLGVYFTDPAGNVAYRPFGTPGTIYVCAAGGWMGIVGGGAGSVTVCSTGEVMSKAAGAPANQKQLTWDCDILQ